MRMMVAAVAMLPIANGAMAAPPSAAERAALERLARDSDQAWGAKAVDRFVAHHAPGGSVRIGGDPAIVGETAMRAYFGRAFAARPRLASRQHA